MDYGLFFVLALLLATLVEAGTEYLFGTPFDKIPQLKDHKWTLMYAALVVGILVTVYYQLDLVSLLVKGEPSLVGEILTGTVIGRGSNYLNDLWSKFLVPKG